MSDKFKAMQSKLNAATQKLTQEQDKIRNELPDEPGIASDLVTEERKLRDLEAKHYKLLAENNNLKHNQAICDANVLNFVREMNSLLD